MTVVNAKLLTIAVLKFGGLNFDKKYLMRFKIVESAMCFAMEAAIFMLLH